VPLNAARIASRSAFLSGEVAFSSCMAFPLDRCQLKAFRVKALHQLANFGI
jgi:hypothetical protein